MVDQRNHNRDFEDPQDVNENASVGDDGCLDDAAFVVLDEREGVDYPGNCGERRGCRYT